MIFLDSQSLYKYLFHISLQALCHFNVIINMNWQSFLIFKEKIKQGGRCLWSIEERYQLLVRDIQEGL